MAAIRCDDFVGCKIWFSNISYACPELKLYGYSTEQKLRNAIKRTLLKRKQKGETHEPGNLHKP